MTAAKEVDDESRGSGPAERRRARLSKGSRVSHHSAMWTHPKSARADGEDVRQICVQKHILSDARGCFCLPQIFRPFLGCATARVSDSASAATFEVPTGGMCYSPSSPMNCRVTSYSPRSV